MNLKIRLNLIITSLLALVMFIGAWLMIDNAREDVRAEVASTASLAIHLLDAEIVHYTSDYGWMNNEDRNKASIFRLQSLDNIRHLKIEFFDAYGRLRDSNRATNKVIEEAPPQWFFKLMDIVSTSMPPIKRHIFANGRIIGELIVTPDPSYEISEIWNDTLGLLILVTVFFVIVNLMVYFAVNSALKPVAQILEALEELEKGNLQARLPAFKLPELKDISIKFNATANTLQKSIESNHSLTQQMIRLQEDERKSLARDLHDEIGQHLAAIHIDASTILNSKTIAAAKKSATEIDAVARQMMNIVHSMLQRLRPGGLDQFGLNVAVQELVDVWRQRNHGIETNIHVHGRLDGIDETISIAAYRIIQECLTNVSKHANASMVNITILRLGDKLDIKIADNGLGFSQDKPISGFGLAGMRERVEGLGGQFDIVNTQQGVSVEVMLPYLLKYENKGTPTQ